LPDAKAAPPYTGYTDAEADRLEDVVGVVDADADDVPVLAAVPLSVAVAVAGGVAEGLAPSVFEDVAVGLLEGVPLALGVCVLEGVMLGDGGSGAHATAWNFVLGGGMASTVAPVGASVASHDSSADG